jgi:hypothetical protein
MPVEPVLAVDSSLRLLRVLFQPLRLSPFGEELPVAPAPYCLGPGIVPGIVPGGIVAPAPPGPGPGAEVFEPI